jgi:hypothetical protein
MNIPSTPIAISKAGRTLVDDGHHFLSAPRRILRPPPQKPAFLERSEGPPAAQGQAGALRMAFGAEILEQGSLQRERESAAHEVDAETG